jgi:hypothetical protein
MNEENALSEDSGTIDKFELVSAIVLGLAAVGASWAGYQGDLWGGQSVEGYADANRTATRAESAYNRAASEAERDIALDIQGKQSVLTAMNTQDADDGTAAVNYAIAGYLYQEQLSEEGYKAMKLPEEFYRTSLVEGGKDMPGEVLAKTLDESLGDEHYNQMIAPSIEMSDEADAAFKKAQDANETGDKFGLITMIYAVCLFLTGIGLVVKSKVRWSFVGFGGVTFAGATVYLLLVPWA